MRSGGKYQQHKSLVAYTSLVSPEALEDPSISDNTKGSSFYAFCYLKTLQSGPQKRAGMLNLSFLEGSETWQRNMPSASSLSGLKHFAYFFYRVKVWRLAVREPPILPLAFQKKHVSLTGNKNPMLPQVTWD
jgi:hypothetical protein